MTKEDNKIINNEISQTYELYGFEMSFSEFKDIFELGAAFGYELASMKKADTIEVNTPHTVKRSFLQKVINKNYSH